MFVLFVSCMKKKRDAQVIEKVSRDNLISTLSEVESYLVDFALNYSSLDSICYSYEIEPCLKSRNKYVFIASNGLFAIQKGLIFNFKPVQEHRYSCLHDYRNIPIVINKPYFINLLSRFDKEYKIYNGKYDVEYEYGSYKVRGLSINELSSLRTYSSLNDEMNECEEHKYIIVDSKSNVIANTVDFLNYLDTLLSKAHYEINSSSKI